MKEKINLIVLIIVFVALLIIVNTFLNNKNTVQDVKENIIEESEVKESEEKISIQGNTTTSVISSYSQDNSVGFEVEVPKEEKTGEVYKVTEENFTKEVLKSKKKVLVEFYADWCGPCKTLAPILEEIAKENLDLKVVKVNVDECTYIASQYGAYYIPLLVVIEDGEKIDSAVGALPKKDILELVK